MTLAPPSEPPLTWRSLTRDDVAELHALVRRAQAADGSHELSSLDDVENEFAEPYTDAATDSIAAVASDGRIVAFGWAFPRPDGRTERTCFLWGEVDPEMRRRGLGSFVLQWTERRACELLGAMADDAPRVIRTRASDDAPDRHALFDHHGYRPVRWFHEMRRDLRDPIAASPAVTGVTFEPWSNDLDEPTRLAHNEAFADHFGSLPLSPDRWSRWLTGSHHFRPDLTVVATEAGAVAGYVLCHTFPEEDEAHGFKMVWLGQIGVRREWRRRGVASALIVRALRAAADDGADYGALGVDVDNPTGALRLYERHGFITFDRSTTFEKPFT